MPRVSKWAHLKDEALRCYAAGEFYTDLHRRLGVPLSTLCRWAHAAGIDRSLSESKARQVAQRPGGAAHLGLKGAFHGPKAGWIATDSAYEWARLEQLEADPEVLCIERCGLLIRYVFEGREHVYAPDFSVTLTDGTSRIEEVKPQRFLTDARTGAKVQAGQRACDEAGLRFALITEEDIGAEALAAATGAIRSRQSPEYQAAKREIRLAQRRRAQRRYNGKRRDEASPEELDAYRKQAAARLAAWRLRLLASGDVERIAAYRERYRASLRRSYHRRKAQAPTS